MIVNVKTKNSPINIEMMNIDTTNTASEKYRYTMNIVFDIWKILFWMNIKFGYFTGIEKQ